MTTQGKVIIVAGAGTRIGGAVAALLSKRGASLVLAGWRIEALRRLEDSLPGSLAIPTDVTAQPDALRLVRQTVDTFGRIDGLIYCMDHAIHAQVVETDIDIYRGLFEINVVAPLQLLKLLAPVMRRQRGGSIVIVGSRSSGSHAPGFGAYASTKLALSALCETARHELADERICISMVHPAVPEEIDGADVPRTRTRRVAEAICSVLESGTAELQVI